MSADVVMGPDLPLSVSDDEEGEACLSDAHIVAFFGKPCGMSSNKPSLGEDGASFQLIHGIGAIP